MANQLRIAQGIAPLQALANALAVPARINLANRQAELERAFLGANAGILGLDPAMV